MRTTFRTLMWASAAVLCLTGCQSLNNNPLNLPHQEFVGHYRKSAEGSWFVSCGSESENAPMWVTFIGDGVRQFEHAQSSIQLQQSETYFVRWRAALVTDGHVGPRGEGKPALLVREIVQMQASDGMNCPSAAPH